MKKKMKKHALHGLMILLLTIACTSIGETAGTNHAAASQIGGGSTNDSGSVETSVAALLQYADTNLLFMAAGDDSSWSTVEKINTIADKVRPRVYNPLYICRMRDTAGVTNVVYVEGNYPWGWPSDLLLRISAICPCRSEPKEFYLGHRRLISRFQLDSVTNATVSYDVLNIYTIGQPSDGENKTPYRVRLASSQFERPWGIERWNTEANEWKAERHWYQRDGD